MIPGCKVSWELGIRLLKSDGLPPGFECDIWDASAMVIGSVRTPREAGEGIV